MGNEQDARKVLQTLDRTQQLLARMDAVVARADRQVFGAAGQPGLVAELRATVAQASGLLQDTRQSLVEAAGRARRLEDLRLNGDALERLADQLPEREA